MMFAPSPYPVLEESFGITARAEWQALPIDQVRKRWSGPSRFDMPYSLLIGSSLLSLGIHAPNSLQLFYSPLSLTLGK